jgi:hypothetical protein
MSNNKKQSKEEKEVVVVESQPINEPKQTAPSRVDNIKIDKIGSLTLNIVADPLKKRYEKHYKENKVHLIIDIVLAVIVLILLGVILNLWLFSKTKLNNLVDFQVSSTPSELINGQETEFTINYTNTTKDTLTDVRIVLKRPDSLHNPTYNLDEFDTKTNTLIIGDFAPKAHGEFKIDGFLLGNLDSGHEFLAVINYKNKYGQNKQEFFRRDFELNGSALNAQLVLPERIIATSPFTAKVTAKNTSDINFDNLKITMAWPDNTVLVKSDLGDSPDEIWTIGNYQAGQEGEYNFDAKAYVASPQNINIAANFYATYDNNEYLLAQAQGNVFVDFSKVEVGLTNLENNLSINPGGGSTFTVTYKNNEKYPITNVELGLRLKGSYALSETTSVNQTKYPQLARIESGQEATVEVSIQARSVIDFNNENENYEIAVSSFARFDDPVEKSRISVESRPVKTQVSSRLTLDTKAVFFTSLGDQIGVGSVPPVVSEYTSYWVIVRAINTNNNIKDLNITAKIPGGVEFTDIFNVTAGNQIVYDENSRTINWNIGEIDKFAGIFEPAPEARIQLAIVPEQAQIGSSPALLTNITATATDQKTGAFLTAAGKNITTAIFSDDLLNKVIQ